MPHGRKELSDDDREVRPTAREGANDLIIHPERSESVRIRSCQYEEGKESIFDFITHAPKDSQARRVVATDRGRIFETPVKTFRVSWKDLESD